MGSQTSGSPDRPQQHSTGRIPGPRVNCWPGTRTTDCWAGKAAGELRRSWFVIRLWRSVGCWSPTLEVRAPSPHQPPGCWENLNFRSAITTPARVPKQYRRGLYTWWQRSYVHPSLLAFDAPTREECAAERNRSNIPQQALVLLNDPSYVRGRPRFAVRIPRRPPQPMTPRERTGPGAKCLDAPLRLENGRPFSPPGKASRGIPK